MKAVVTGAAGFIGRALVARLSSQGHDVVAVARRTTVIGVRYTTVSLGQALPGTILDGADVVFHLAHDHTPGAQRTNIDGTVQWFEQARRAGVPWQVFASSYSSHHDSPSEYGRTKYELEKLLLERGATILRPGLVLGWGGTFGRMAGLIQRLPMVPVPGGELTVFVTDLHDMLPVISSREFARRELNLFEPSPVSLMHLLMRTRAALRRNCMLLSIPAAISLASLAPLAALHTGLRSYAGSLAALRASQSYGYRSSYDEIGIPRRPLDERLKRALSSDET